MRVAICVDEFPKLSETFVLDHAAVLRRSGHSVQILANRPSGEIVSHPEASALLELVTYGGSSRLRQWGGAAVRALGTLGMPLDSDPPLDITHCHFGPVGLQRIAMRHRPRSRLVVSFHGYDLVQFPARHGRDAYAPLFAAADVILTNTDYGRTCLIDLGCPANHIQLLPLGIDLPRFPFRQRSWQGGPVMLATVARLVEKKGLDVALRAVARLAPRYPSLRYHVIGDGPLRHPLEELTAALGLQDVVVFNGWQSRAQVVQALDRAHLFVLPSVRASDGDVDTQGLVVQEAQAMGLPVIVSRVGGLAEGIADGLSGYAVPPRDPQALAGRIEFLLEDPERWPMMGGHGRAFVERHYSMDRFAERLHGIYQSLAAETSRR